MKENQSSSSRGREISSSATWAGIQTPTASTSTSSAAMTKQEPPTSPASAMKFNVSSPTIEPLKLVLYSDSEDDVKMEQGEEATFEMPPTNHLDDEFQTAAESVTTSKTGPLDTNAVGKGNELVRFEIHFL